MEAIDVNTTKTDWETKCDTDYHFVPKSVQHQRTGVFVSKCPHPTAVTDPTERTRHLAVPLTVGHIINIHTTHLFTLRTTCEGHASQNIQYKFHSTSASNTSSNKPLFCTHHTTFIRTRFCVILSCTIVQNQKAILHNEIYKCAVNAYNK